MRSSSGGGAYSGSLNSAYSDWATAWTCPARSGRDSASGPIGCAQPSTMPVSMSAAVAKPDSTIRIAASRYGISSALTTKPARSLQMHDVLVELPDANASARCHGLG